MKKQFLFILAALASFFAYATNGPKLVGSMASDGANGFGDRYQIHWWRYCSERYIQLSGQCAWIWRAFTRQSDSSP